MAISACTFGEERGEPPPYRGEWYREELERPNTANLFGMCYIAYEGAVENGVDYRKAFQLLANMGVKSVRNWMHFNWMLTGPDTLNEQAVSVMRDILAEAGKYGFQIIGMNHSNWSPNGYFTLGKQRRQDYEGSPYYAWLEQYETSWYTLVSAFPEVTYWEIDNELNNGDFMYIEGEKGNLLPTEEMAHIAADMLYYGSRGIHRANPNAITIMGGLVDPWGLGIPTTGNETNVGFLEKLYDCIDSGEHGSLYPDDFFQCAAWHPYYYRSGADDYFVEQNNAIYEVVRRREGKDKKVFLTEFGWNDAIVTQEQITEWVPGVYALIRERMPDVESLHYFRMMNDLKDMEWGGANAGHEGFFYDCDPARGDTDGAGNPAAGKPKPSAYAYQRAAGGQGSLELFLT